MGFRTIKAAVDLKQPFRTVNNYQETTFCPGVGSRNIFDLGDMTSSIYLTEIIDLQFCAVKELCYRDCTTGATASTLDELLPTANRKNWVLSGYYANAEGLMLEFLPKYSQWMFDDANKYYEAIQRMNPNGNSDADDDVDEVLSQQQSEESDLCARAIYKKYSKTIAVTGTFQCWEQQDHRDAVIIACTDEKVIGLRIENGAKTEKVVFYRNGQKNPRCIAYD